MNRERMEQGVRELLAGLFEGEDGIADEERARLLAETPGRVAQAFAADLLGGYHDDLAGALDPIPAPGATGPVLLHGIRFTAMCAHHLLPFRGVAHVGFVPQGAHVGLGGLARLVDALARRLTIQEQLTSEIADRLEQAIAPRSVLVAIEAEHLCLSVRGARKTGHRFRTVERRGAPCADLEALLQGEPGRW